MAKRKPAAKRGRPAVFGERSRCMVLLPAELMQQMDAWRKPRKLSQSQTVECALRLLMNTQR
jgi:hypothetical protein